MAGRKLVTYCVDGTWRNRIDDRDPLSGEYPSREEAVADGRTEARTRSLEHVIQRTDGTVAERNRYPRLSEEIPG